jgi:hypothetical protein
MDLTNTPTARKLRQDIQAIRHKKFGWSDDVVREILITLGFGESLRALDEDRLDDLKFLLVELHPTGQPEAFVLDRQGRFAMHLARKIGWEERELRLFLLKRFSKSHWNVLETKEKRAVIAMFQNYLKKQSQQ